MKFLYFSIISYFLYVEKHSTILYKHTLSGDKMTKIC